MDVLIVTGDRDAYQLVDEHVTVADDARKGISDMTRFTPEEVMAKYGLTPAQYPDFAALRGDPSDNLPGVPGVGEKTAIKLVQQFGDARRSCATAWTRSPARSATASASTSPTSCATAPLTELRRDVPARCRSGRPEHGPAGTATRCTRSSTTCSSRCCASGSSPRCRRSSPRPTRASTSRRASWPAASSAAGSSRCRRALASGCTCAAPGAAAPATRTGSRSPIGERRGCLPAPRVAGRRRGVGAGGVARRRAMPKAVHDMKGPMLALSRARLGARTA